MVKAVLLTVSVILSVTVKVNTLQCYVCYDCLQVKDEYLTSCDSLVSTTTPASTTTVSSTSSTTTTAPGTSTTTTVAPETNTTTTTTTTVPPEANTTTTTTTTEVPETSTNTTTTTTTITVPPVANTTTTTTTTTTTQPETKTSAQTYVEESTNQLLAAETSLRRVRRADITYECFQGKVHVNNTDVIVRGCAAGRTNQTCEQFGLTGCSFCDTDKCNGAWTMQPSLIVLLATFFLLPVIKE